MIRVMLRLGLSCLALVAFCLVPGLGFAAPAAPPPKRQLTTDDGSAHRADGDTNRSRYWRSKLLLGFGVPAIAMGLASVVGAIYLFTRKDNCAQLSCVGNDFGNKAGGVLLTVIGSLMIAAGIGMTVGGALWYRRYGAALKKTGLVPSLLLDPVSNSYGLSLRGRF